MSVDTDKMRRAANGLEAFAPFAAALQVTVAHACDMLRAGAEEIDELRKEVDRTRALWSEPSPADRMMRHRSNASAIVAAEIAAGRLERTGAPGWNEHIADRIESLAHAMLAAERPPAATVATARPAVTEAQIAEWSDIAMGVYERTRGGIRPAMGAAVRHVLTLAGAIESAEKGASA